MAWFSLEGNPHTSVWSPIWWLFRKRRNVSKLGETVFLEVGSFSEPSLYLPYILPAVRAAMQATAFGFAPTGEVTGYKDW